MKIKIVLTEGDKRLKPVKFRIQGKALVEAVKTGYLGLGTPYDPIRIDNFVILGNHEFPKIRRDTEISIFLKPGKRDKGKAQEGLQLICCKVKNVGKLHNDAHESTLEGPWQEIFDFDPNDELIKTVPDGALYIAPNEDEKCQIKTCKKVPNSYLAYSMLFCLTIRYEKRDSRTYYFILDPVVEISSNRRQ